MKVAAIDIGANSIHLVVSRLYAPGVRETLDRSREMLRLGRSVFQRGFIPPAELDRAIEVLKRFRAISETHGVEAVLAVATSAVRDARNRARFVERAEKEARLAVRVVSGEEEGRLIYAGVRDGLPLTFHRIAVIDIGGGSAEIILGDGPRVAAVRSLKLGVLRLAAQFPGRRSRTLKAMKEHVRSLLAPSVDRIRRRVPDAALGTSGTVLTLADLLGVREEGSIRLDALEELSDELLSEPPRKLRELPSVGDSRADTIGPGSLVLRVFMEEAGLLELFPCERALREGVVADYAQRNASQLQIKEGEIADPRRRSVHVVARRLGALDLHARQTARLALRLFDDLAPLHRLDGRDRELLEYAALLHDAGYWISAEKHHKHAYYLIWQAPLEGFSREEARIIALVARYHRGALPRTRHAEFAKLPRRARRRVRALAALLRIADGLDRSHAGMIRDLEVDVGRKRVQLRLVATGDPNLELYTVDRRADLFRKVYNRELQVTARRNGTP